MEYDDVLLVKMSDEADCSAMESSFAGKNQPQRRCFQRISHEFTLD
jgi:hypothetical protein